MTVRVAAGCVDHSRQTVQSCGPTRDGRRQGVPDKLGLPFLVIILLLFLVSCFLFPCVANLQSVSRLYCRLP